jgi:outer membrane protein assembly factor BamB
MKDSIHYVVGLCASVWLFGAAHAQDVLMQHNDKSRTGANLHETVLNAKTVGPKFGKLWSLYADGQVVAQPLYVSGLRVDTAANPNAPLVQGTFNAVVIATMHNTIYVYDADQEKPGPAGRTVPLWATWLGQPRPGGKDIDMWSTNDPEWGILSTPVINDDKSVLYVAAWHDEGANGFQYRLHALDLKNGTQRHPPVAIGHSSRDPSNPCQKQSIFNPCSHKQRAGLLLDRGVLYVGFGGDGNRGALFAFDATNLTKRAFWSSTPDGKDGGIWQSGQAPAVDGEGNIYLMTGNGSFDADKKNYGNSFVKLKLEASGFTVKDYFTPCNVHALNGKDLDVGSAGPVLVPGEPARIVGGGKEGVLYVLSPANMGKFSNDAAAPDCRNPNIIQQVDAFPQVHGHWGNIHGSPVFWQGPHTGHIYAWGENSPLKAYEFSAGQLQNTDQPRQSGFRPPIGMPGGMLSLSADGAKAGTGVLWAVVPLDGDANQQRGVKGILLALDAEDAARTLWTSEQTPSRDQLGLFAKFSPPTVAGGKVFVATYGDDEVRRIYAGNEQPTQFPKHYYVAVYGVRDDRLANLVTVDQDRDDVALVRADTTPLALDKTKCRPIDIGSLDCTDVLGQAAQAPAFHRVIFAAGTPMAGCALLRVTTAAKNSALDGATGIGFWSTQAVDGNQAAENAGLFVRKDQLKATGSAKLKNGAPATLHEFVGVTNCPIPGAGSITRRFKPFMEFDTADGKVFRNWDLAQNYEIGEGLKIDRTGDVLAP